MSLEEKAVASYSDLLQLPANKALIRCASHKEVDGLATLRGHKELPPSLRFGRPNRDPGDNWFVAPSTLPPPRQVFEDNDAARRKVSAPRRMSSAEKSSISYGKLFCNECQKLDRQRRPSHKEDDDALDAGGAMGIPPSTRRTSIPNSDSDQPPCNRGWKKKKVTPLQGLTRRPNRGNCISLPCSLTVCRALKKLGMARACQLPPLGASTVVSCQKLPPSLCLQGVLGEDALQNHESFGEGSGMTLPQHCHRGMKTATLKRQFDAEGNAPNAPRGPHRPSASRASRSNHAPLRI